MQLKSLFALALAGAASANPVTDLTADIAARSSRDPCDGGRDYCGWFDKSRDIAPQCKCPRNQSWSERKHRCVAPPIPKPTPGHGQKVICARDRDNYCDYDEREEFCEDDGKNVVIIIDIDINITVVKPVIEEESRKPKCAAGQYWKDETHKCHYPPLPREKASSCKRKGGRPICARNPNDYCDFDERDSLCDDDGINTLQCIEERERPEVILKELHADIDFAVDTLGFDCLCYNTGCDQRENVWALFGDVKKVVGLLCDMFGLIC